MNLKRGDHICSVYSTPLELAQTVAEFVDDGLSHRQRCWYVASGDETDLVKAALENRGVDVDAQTQRGALKLIAGSGTYRVRGSFRAEHSIQVFNDAIEQACLDGFTGFRAAADMSWALQLPDGPSQLIVYEALLRALFSSCRAVGLCLYNRHRMPLAVLDGALATHPKVQSNGEYRENKFYDVATTGLRETPERIVLKMLRDLNRTGR